MNGKLTVWASTVLMALCTCNTPTSFLLKERSRKTPISIGVSREVYGTHLLVKKRLGYRSISADLSVLNHLALVRSHVKEHTGVQSKKKTSGNNVAKKSCPIREAIVGPMPGVVKASWYGPGFNGKTMANGKVFRQSDPTVVAHRTLPFGTVLEVTHIKSKKSVKVRVQDRGPFVECREADLSREAAAKLGMNPGDPVHDEGVAPVTIRILSIPKTEKAS